MSNLNLSHHSEEHTQVTNTLQKLDAFVHQIIFQAGCDRDSQPLLVICASRFPATSDLPPGTDFSMLVNRALSLLSPYTAAGPYSLIIFASPSDHGPNVKQVISSYLRLDRATRKNLKTLWVVHPSFWAKMTLQVFLNGIVSWKVGRKVKWMNSLSALATEVPIHQICIPPEVYKTNLNIEPTIVVPLTWTRKPVIGTPLEELMGEHCQKGIPSLVQDSVLCIRSTGLTAEGLFRRPPSQTTLRILSEAYDRGHPVKISDYQDAPYLAASLLKLFLRQLPVPLFPPSLYPIITACPSIEPMPSDRRRNGSSEFTVEPNSEALMYVRENLLVHMSSPSLRLLAHVLRLCHDLALHADENKMDAHNLATCLAPTLIRSDDLMKDAAMCKLPPASLSQIANTSASNALFNISGTSFGSVLKLMISNFPELFQNMDESPDVTDIPQFYSAHTSPNTTSSSSAEYQEFDSFSPSSGSPVPTEVAAMTSSDIHGSSTFSPSPRLVSALRDQDRRASYSHLPKTTHQSRQTSHHHSVGMTPDLFAFASDTPSSTLSQHKPFWPTFLSGSGRLMKLQGAGLGFGSILATTEVDGTNAHGRVSVRNVFQDDDEVD